MIDVLIERAEVDDLPDILALQHRAFISEAELFGTSRLPPHLMICFRNIASAWYLKWFIKILLSAQSE